MSLFWSLPVCSVIPHEFLVYLLETSPCNKTYVMNVRILMLLMVVPASLFECMARIKLLIELLINHLTT